MTILEKVYLPQQAITAFQERTKSFSTDQQIAAQQLNEDYAQNAEAIQTQILTTLTNFDQILEISTIKPVVSSRILPSRLFYLQQHRFFVAKKQSEPEGGFFDCGDVADLPNLLLPSLKPLVAPSETLPATPPFFRKRLDDLLLNQLDPGRRTAILKDLNWSEITTACFLRTLLANDTTAVLLTKRNLNPYAPLITQLKRKETAQLFIWIGEQQNWFLKFDDEKNNTKGVLQNTHPVELLEEIKRFCLA